MSMKKIVISGMIGNALEWYDFALYAQLIPIISKLFIPVEDQHMGMLFAYIIFAIGFITRPVGGIFFGYIGDKFGRKSSLVLSILLMAIPTAAIGILPTYERIGILAPIVLVLVRLLQGLSLGGGFSGCIAYITEHAPKNKRGIAGSTSFFSMCAGILFGLLVVHGLTHALSKEAFYSWGWRIPFIASLFIGMVAFYIRNHLHESPIYLEAKENGTLSSTPLREIFTNYMPELLVAIGIYLTVTVPFYSLVGFMNNYMQVVFGHSIKDASAMNIAGITAMMLCVPISSTLSDKFGRKPLLMISSIILVTCTYPVFWLLAQPGFVQPLMGHIIFGVIVALYIAPVPAVLVELFPTSVRFSGIALSYNLSAAIFGGTTPAVALWLMEKTHMKNILAFYIIAFALLSLKSLSYYKDKFDQPLA